MPVKELKLTPMQALAAAGRTLKIIPETFDISMGRMIGHVVNMETEEKVEPAPKKVISFNGDIVALPGKKIYATHFTVVWDQGSAEDAVAQLKKEVLDPEQQLKTKMEFSDLESLEYFWVERE